MKTIFCLLVVAFLGCNYGNENYKTKVVQTIKRTCDDPDCYYALYTWVYFKGALVHEWIDDAENLTPVQVIGRRKEGDSLIFRFKKLDLKYENLLQKSQ